METTRATVTPEGADPAILGSKKFRRAREWRAVECSVDSSVSGVTYMSEKVHPYVEIGKQLQELRNLVRESCSPDQNPNRASRGSIHHSHDFSGSHSEGIHRPPEDPRASNDDKMYSIKIDHSFSDAERHHSSTSTPKRPPRYAVITPEESLMDAIASHDQFTGKTESVDPAPSGASVAVRDIQHAAIEQHNGTDSAKGKDELYSNEASSVEGHSALYWTQVSRDMETHLDEVQRSYSSKLLTMNQEHEELEERQQNLLEELGERLSHALKGEQFWKQTLKRVVKAHKQRIESSFQRSPSSAVSCINGEEGLSNSALRQELMSEGIEVPTSLFEWSVSTNGSESDSAENRKMFDSFTEDAMHALEEKLEFSEKVRRANVTYTEMLRKQNAALAAGLSAITKPENTATYRKTLRSLMSTANNERPYASADNGRYSCFIDATFSNTAEKYSESLFTELAEFEICLRDQYENKLKVLEEEIREVETRHATELRDVAAGNQSIVSGEKDKLVSELKEKYREKLHSFELSMSEASEKNSTELRNLASDLDIRKKKELSDVRLRIESDYTRSVTELTQQVRKNEENFAAQRLHLSEELTTTLLQQKEKCTEEIRTSFLSEVADMEEKMENIRENHEREVESLSQEYEKEISRAREALQADMTAEHERTIESLTEEMAAQEARHNAIKAELIADYEIALEEEKLAVYSELRGECDVEIARIEAEIKSTQESAAAEISDMRTQLERQKEGLLLQQQQQFKILSDNELQLLRSRLQQLDESFNVEIKALEDEHLLALQRARAEVYHKIETKHTAERSSLLATLNALKESVAKEMNVQKSQMEAEIEKDLVQILESARHNHDIEVEELTSRTGDKSIHYAEELRSTELKHSNALVQAYATLESEMEDDYMQDMCRISGEIDAYKAKQLDGQQAKEQSNTNVVGTVETETQTDFSEIEVGSVDEDVDLPPNYTDTIVSEKLDALRDQLVIEHCNEITSMKSLHEYEMEKLKTTLEAQKNELSVEVRKLNSELELSVQRDQSNHVAVGERHRVMEEEITELKTELDAVKAAETKSEEDKRSVLSALRLELQTMKQVFVTELEKRNLEAAQFKATIDDLTERNIGNNSVGFVKDSSASEKIRLSESSGSVITANNDSKYLAEITRLEGLIQAKASECEQVTAQVQSMFRLIDAYRGRYNGSDDSQLVDLTNCAIKAVGNVSATNGTNTGVVIDGVTYSSNQLMDALKKTVKQKNISQKLCRQQQLCILALRLLIQNLEKKVEKTRAFED